MKIETKYNPGQELYIIDGSSIVTKRVTKVTVEKSVYTEGEPLITYYFENLTSSSYRYESEVSDTVEGLILLHAKLAHL